MVLGNEVVARTALRLANQRMRREVLPLLSNTHPRPNSWNPLRADFKGPSAYGMKLWLPDKLALEILKSDQLMTLTTQIVIQSTVEGAMAKPKPFVTNILDALMDDHG